jgi:hypothetical protein
MNNFRNNKCFSIGNGVNLKLNMVKSYRGYTRHIEGTVFGKIGKYISKSSCTAISMPLRATISWTLAKKKRGECRLQEYVS